MVTALLEFLEFHWPAVTGCASIVLSAWALFRFFTPKPLGTIPHNTPIKWLVGDILSINDYVERGLGLGRWLTELAFRCGPISTVHISPFLTKVVVTDPREVEDILGRRWNEFGYSSTQSSIFGGVMPNGMLSIPSDSMWKAHRKALTPAMSVRYLKHCTPRISHIAKRLSNLWEKKRTLMPQDACFEIEADFQLATMDAISATVFGEAFGGVRSAQETLDRTVTPVPVDHQGAAHFQFPHVPVHHAVRVLFMAMGEAVLSPLPKISYWFIRRRKSFREALRLWDEYVTENLRHTRAKFVAKVGVEEPDLPDASIYEMENIAGMVYRRTEQDGALPDDELKDEFLTILLAGQDSTSAALNWCIKFLAHHPQAQLKLRQELAERCGLHGTADDRDILWKDVLPENTPYLEAVVMECLRLGQVGLIVSRQAACDTQILGHFIPKGTEIALHLGHAGVYDTIANEYAAAQYHPVRGHDSKKKTDCWKDDGIAFNPDRWVDEKGQFNPKAGLTLPFGGGPRLCLGHRLAILQMRVFLATLTPRFFFEPPKNPELDSWKVKETVVRYLQHTYFRIKPWNEVPSSV